MKTPKILPVLFFAVAANAGQNETEMWNKGVDSYRSGDVTNTLRIMKPLMLDSQYSARSSEVVAKLEFERGNFEESARAAQVALRKSPDDPARKGNFYLAVSRIPDVILQKRIAESQKLFEGKDPSQIVYDGLLNAREIMQKCISFQTNSAERAIALADGMSMKADKIALLCPGLKSTLQNAVTNQEQIAAVSLQIDNLEKSALDSARMLSDMDENAYSSIASSEMDLNRLFKLAVLPPAAIDEGIICQSNQFLNVNEINSRSWQREALDFTRVFRAKFASWAKAYEDQTSSNTNMPPFSAEAQNEIASLSHELEKIQLSCIEKDLPDEMLAALKIMFRIRELLPKNGNSGSSPNSGKNNDRGNQSKSDGGQKGNQGAKDGSENRLDDNASREAEEKTEEDKGNPAESAEDQTRDQEEMDAILNRAKERNDEYESEKKMRMRKVPLPPNQRDW